MSYGVYLNCPCCKRTVVVDTHQEGGTIAVGGTADAHMSVTYNYGKDIHEQIAGGLSSLNEMPASDSIPLLEKAVVALGTTQDRDYWAATPGNAGHALSVMLAWARAHPTAVWEID